MPWGKVVGAFHPLIPDVICVRNLKPETVAHEFGHFYYHWYVAPALGRYENLKKRIESQGDEVVPDVWVVRNLKKRIESRTSSAGSPFMTTR